ncbi:MAG: 6-phosphogluconolactonase, partial [Armatimonadota bacterium]
AFPVPVDLPTASESAQAYERQILNVVGSPPIFDLVLLGMGEDGHTASLFPGKAVLHSKAWVEAAPHGALPPPVERITFTFPLICNARSVLLTATGSSKAPALNRWTSGRGDIDSLPVMGLGALETRLRVLADRDAAGGR